MTEHAHITSSSELALQIEQLACGYASGKKHQQAELVLDKLDLSVEQGEIVCLLGASGCGKTTLLKAIAGLQPLTAGRITLNGRLIDDGHTWVPPEQRNMGLIFQDYALFPHLSIAENVAFGLQGKTASERQTIVADMLSLVHLSRLEQRYPHQLSGGQQQRVAIARSLACQPQLLLLDEPFSNIDTQVRHELIRDIRHIFKQQGLTAIFVTHSREEAFAFSDKMAVMNQGVIEQFGSASQLYYQPSSRFVADFLGGGSYLPAKKIAANQFETDLGVMALSHQDSIEIGHSGKVLLRPQQVVFTPVEKSTMTVIEQQFMGDHYRYQVMLGDTPLWGQSNQFLEIGQAVSAKVNYDQALFFR